MFHRSNQWYDGKHRLSIWCHNRTSVVLSIHWRTFNWDQSVIPDMEWIDDHCVENELQKQLFAEDLRFDSSPDDRHWLSSASTTSSSGLDVRHESHNRQMSPDLTSMATLATKWRLSRSSDSHRRPDYDLSSGRKARALDSITTVVIDSQTMDDIWYSLSSRTSSPMTRLWPVLCPTGYAPVVDTTAVTESTTLSPNLKYWCIWSLLIPNNFSSSSSFTWLRIGLERG